MIKIQKNQLFELIEKYNDNFYISYVLSDKYLRNDINKK